MPSIQIFLDTETTGKPAVDGHRIIEVGCVEAIDQWFTGNNYHARVNPCRPVDVEAVKKHGITDQDLIGAPLFADIAEQLCEYLNGAEILIHNAPFDLEFLNKEFSLLGRADVMTGLGPVIDTLSLARTRHPGLPNSLNALCTRYEVDTSKRTFHAALIDARLLGEVYFAMTGGQKGLELLGDQDTTPYADLMKRLAVSSDKPLRIIKASQDELEAHTIKMEGIQVRHLKTLTGQLDVRKERKKILEKHIARIDSLHGLIEQLRIQLASVSPVRSGEPVIDLNLSKAQIEALQLELENLRNEQIEGIIEREDHAAGVEVLHGLIQVT